MNWTFLIWAPFMCITSGICICLTIIFSVLKVCHVPAIDYLLFQKPAEGFQIPLILTFLSTALMGKNVLFVRHFLPKNRDIFCRFYALVSDLGPKVCMYSCFNLLAQVSSFVPSVNTVSFDNASVSSSLVAIW